MMWIMSKNKSQLSTGLLLLQCLYVLQQTFSYDCPQRPEDILCGRLQVIKPNSNLVHQLKKKISIEYFRASVHCGVCVHQLNIRSCQHVQQLLFCSYFPPVYLLISYVSVHGVLKYHCYAPAELGKEGATFQPHRISYLFFSSRLYILNQKSGRPVGLNRVCSCCQIKEQN